MFMKRILVDFIQTSTHVPIFVELKTLSNINNLNEFESFIFNNVSCLGLNINEKQFFSSLASGKYIFLLDGYDEISHTLTNSIDIFLQQFINKYSENIFVISSRPGISFSSWTTFEEFNIEPLNKIKVLILAKKLLILSGIQNNFVESIDAKLYDSHKEFLSIPLLLTIMLITYQEAGEIPDNYTEFYEYCYNALFYKHDANKGLKRELKTNLSESDFQKILNYLALKSFTAQKVNFDRSYIDKLVIEAVQYYNFSNEVNTDDFIYDSTLGICMMINEGTTFKFSHRSFQEFFAACFTIHQSDSFFENQLFPWILDSGFNFQDQATFINTIENKAYNRLIENIVYPMSKWVYQKTDNLSHHDIIKKYITSVTIDPNTGFSYGFSYTDSTLNTIFSLADYITYHLNFTCKNESQSFIPPNSKDHNRIHPNTNEMNPKELDLALQGHLQITIRKIYIVREWYKQREKTSPSFEIKL